MFRKNTDSQIKEEPLWKPTEENLKHSNMTHFINYLNRFKFLKISDYEQLYKWSVENIEQFWSYLLEYSEIRLKKKYTSILKTRKDTIEGAKWFEDAELNFAENLLRYKDEQIAIISWQENQQPTYIRYYELYDEVAKCAAGLKKLGVGIGDRVAALLPNIPESVIAMLATTSLGAIWSSTSPDFGFQGVLDRFSQIRPKVLITVNGYCYNGIKYEISETIIKLQHKLTDLAKTVIVNNLNNNNTKINDFILWDDLISNHTGDIEFQQVPFNHPVYIMFSSGTTGIPKCIVHGGGGTLLQHYKELSLHTNLSRDDVIMYYTTCGWMMWNWLVSSLYIGATVFLFDGSPAYPDIEILWKAVEKEHITIFGTSPKYLTSCQKMKLLPKDKYNLSSLKSILSTGSPLSNENFNYVYSAIKKDVRLSSISGGTDIISCFMLGNPNLPVFSEEIQCRGLGMNVEAWDDNGKPLIEEKGELVCTVPFPSMPVCFWNDPDGEKYHFAYFDYFPGVWRHGDYIKITKRGGVIVYGRSDATLNPGGIRIGTAEIYRVVESIEEVNDSIVVGQNWKNDVRVILFVVLKSGYKLNEDLQKKIKQLIRDNLTPRHVPDKILSINEVPVTLNGKKVEIAVTKIINGEIVKNTDVLANPQSLKQFENLII